MSDSLVTDDFFLGGISMARLLLIDLHALFQSSRGSIVELLYGKNKVMSNQTISCCVQNAEKIAERLSHQAGLEMSVFIREIKVGKLGTA